MKYIDYIKEFEKDKSLEYKIELSRKYRALCWYWCRDYLNMELTEQQEEKLISVAHNIDDKQNDGTICLMRIMDVIVRRVNESNDYKKYIEEEIDNWDERQNIYESCCNY